MKDTSYEKFLAIRKNLAEIVDISYRLGSRQYNSDRSLKASIKRLAKKLGEKITEEQVNEIIDGVITS